MQKNMSHTHSTVKDQSPVLGSLFSIKKRFNNFYHLKTQYAPQAQSYSQTARYSCFFKALSSERTQGAIWHVDGMQAQMTVLLI